MLAHISGLILSKTSNSVWIADHAKNMILKSSRVGRNVNGSRDQFFCSTRPKF